MKKTINKILICVCVIILCTAASSKDWTDNQNTLHKIATLARGLGIDESNPILQEASKLWFFELEDIKILANVVFYEAGGCTDRHQQLVAAVVLNRKKSDKFPNTISEVITQKNQYNSKYLNNLPNYFTANKEMQRCFENAYLAYIGEVECPDNVLFQSNYPELGTGYYEIIEVDTKYFKSTTYFAYG